MVRVLNEKSFEKAVAMASLEEIVESEIQEHRGYQSCRIGDELRVTCDDCGNEVLNIMLDSDEGQYKGAKKGEVLAELLDYDFKDFVETLLETIESRYNIDFAFIISEDCEHLPTVNLKKYVAKTTDEKIKELEETVSKLEAKLRRKTRTARKGTTRKKRKGRK